MSYEDIITIKAFLVALKSLGQPLPEDLQTDLDAIAATLPESAYELHDLAERYAPLNQSYLAALQDLPREGERLKFIASETKPAKGNSPETALTDIESLIQQLHRQVQQHRTEQRHDQKSRSFSLIRDLGWTPEQVIDARSRLLSFEEDWNAPGMELYDDL